MNLTKVYADFYYENTWGYYPFESETEYKKTQRAIEMLIDSRVEKKDIRRVLEFFSKSKNAYVDLEKMPSFLWDSSLIKRDKFYYHPELQLRSPAPRMDKNSMKITREPYYLEMRIMFSTEDLMKYMWDELKIYDVFRDPVRDKGSVEYLINKYKDIQCVEPLDFILFLTNQASKEQRKFTSLLDVTNYEAETLEFVNRMVAEAKVKGASEVTWRS